MCISSQQRTDPRQGHPWLEVSGSFQAELELKSRCEREIARSAAAASDSPCTPVRQPWEERIEC